MPKPKYRSRRLEVLHRTSSDLNRAGALDDAFFRELDEFCLAPSHADAAVEATGQPVPSHVGTLKPAA